METILKTYGTLGEEILSVEEYLAAKDSGKEDTITWECRVDPQADTSILVPAMLIKSFVEHSFLNKISSQPDGGRIDVSVHRTTLGILIMVTDNGTLRYQQYGNGNLIGNRLELLDQQIIDFNKNQEETISYQLLDLAYAEPGQTGTRVLITIAL